MLASLHADRMELDTAARRIVEAVQIQETIVANFPSNANAKAYLQSQYEIAEQVYVALDDSAEYETIKSKLATLLGTSP